MGRYRFADFEFDSAALKLTRNPEILNPGVKPLALLAYLIENRDRIVPSCELFDAIWPDVVVSDAALATTLKRLRSALADDGSSQRWIATFRGRGLKFVGDVSAVSQSDEQVERLLREAELAASAFDWPSVIELLCQALESTSHDFDLRARLYTDLAVAYAWSGNLQLAVEVSLQGAQELALERDEDQAADLLADAADEIWDAMADQVSWRLAAEGLSRIGNRRDTVWARLMTHDVAAREAEDPELGGAPRESVRRDLGRVVFGAEPQLAPNKMTWLFIPYESRDQAIQVASQVPGVLGYWIGAFEEAAGMYGEWARRYRDRGGLSQASLLFAVIAEIEAARGAMREARVALNEAHEIKAQLTALAYPGAEMASVHLDYHLRAAHDDVNYVTGLNVRDENSGDKKLFAAFRRSWTMATPTALLANKIAVQGRRNEALQMINMIMPALRSVPGWAFSYTRGISDAASTLFEVEDTTLAPELESLLRAKTLRPDFRCPQANAHLSLARLLAVQGQSSQAHEEFDLARTSLDQDVALPLRAIADFDEARMWIRKREPQATARGQALLVASIDQFRWIGMPGWLDRAEELRNR